MPDDPLESIPPVIPPAPGSGPAGKNPRCVCEFCGCHLTPTGEIIRIPEGAEARKYREANETLERKDKEIARLQGELAEVKRKLDAGEVPTHHTSHVPGKRIG
jgi:hypothetical protein